MLLIQKVTVVSGKERKEVSFSAFYDDGSTCSMVTADLAKRLGLPTEKKVLMVQSFMHTQTMDTEFAVIELLQEDGNVDQIRAYVVDKITSMAQVKVPEELRKSFKNSTPWPAERYAGEVEILIGMEELAIHPDFYYFDHP